MRLHAILSSALVLSACSQPNPEKLMFVHRGDARAEENPSAMFLEDAMTRLTRDEKTRYERLGKVAGFVFGGQKYTCVVIVNLRTDIINHAPDPAFCYDKGTNVFVDRL
jgi:hypothetical protein